MKAAGIAITVCVILLSACNKDRAEVVDRTAIVRLPWADVVSRARGSTVTWRMWRGDPSVNAYVDRWVAPRLMRDYGISLHAVEGQGPEIVNQLVVERQASARGVADLVWINGETFHNLRVADLLWGPWASRLPNAAALDSTSSIVMRDFEQPLDGWESPWGRVQFALIYDTVRTRDPPRSFADLKTWIRKHPGRFTHDQQFTGVAFLTALMYSLSGGAEKFEGGFRPALYDTASARVFGWLDDVRPNLWRGGRNYPLGVAEMHRLFANDEIDFTMSYNQNEVVTKIRQRVLPPTAHALVITDGTLANAHYVGIPFNSPNPAGAMVVANFLLSPEAQYEKLRPEIWGDETVLDGAKLTSDWRIRFESLAADPHAVPPVELARHAVPEVAPQYREHLAADWKRLVRDRAH